jgi:hypothetical protein
LKEAGRGRESAPGPGFFIDSKSGSDTSRGFIPPDAVGLLPRRCTRRLVKGVVL